MSEKKAKEKMRYWIKLSDVIADKRITSTQRDGTGIRMTMAKILPC